jgi:two-component system, LytTR family, sensor kinase
MNNKLIRKILYQVPVWSVILLLMHLSSTVFPFSTTSFFYLSVVRISVIIVFFNIAHTYLVPIYFAGNKLLFSIVTGTLFVSTVVLMLLIEQQFNIKQQLIAQLPFIIAKINQDGLPLFATLPPTIVVCAVTMSAALLLGSFSAYENRKKAEELANSNRIEAELSLLKSQINPHFLLNSLNNLYGISISEPTKTPKMILKLSEMVSFILYDCSERQINLRAEIQFIKNYLSLQSIRLASNVELIVKITDELPEHVMIEPMILISFIENAFKHGVTLTKPCTIVIILGFKDNQLSLMVENDLIKKSKTNDEINKGMGLSNTLQRIAHSYKDKSDVQIDNGPEKYRITLSITLNEATS